MTRDRPWRILVVEDNPTDVFLIQEALNASGVPHEMSVMPDGAAAIDRSASTPAPDLIILDLHLPKCSGFEVLRHFRVHDRWTGVPVVILSSSDSLADRTQADLLEVAGFCRKPRHLAQFLALGERFKELLIGGRAAS